jgi:hypothetical protein
LPRQEPVTDGLALRGERSQPTSGQVGRLLGSITDGPLGPESIGIGLRRLHTASWLTNAHGPFGVRRQSASDDGALTAFHDPPRSSVTWGLSAAQLSTLTTLATSPTIHLLEGRRGESAGYSSGSRTVTRVT